MYLASSTWQRATTTHPRRWANISSKMSDSHPYSSKDEECVDINTHALGPDHTANTLESDAPRVVTNTISVTKGQDMHKQTDRISTYKKLYLGHLHHRHTHSLKTG